MEEIKTAAVVEPGVARPGESTPVAEPSAEIKPASSKPSALWSLVGLAVIWACFYLVALAQKASDQASPVPTTTPEAAAAPATH